MKLNGQSRSFVRQVQVDLLALCDDDLFQIVHQWVDGSGLDADVQDEARALLGYSRVAAAAAPPPHSSGEAAGTELKVWCAPEPQQLRALLSAMEVSMFAQHVIPLAFQSLHPVYPEWYEGMTFNAHLANYLRRHSHPHPSRGTPPGGRIIGNEVIGKRGTGNLNK